MYPMRSICCGFCARVGVGAMRDLAVAHNENGVAESDRLLQSVRGQNDREALAGQAADELVNLLLGADVEASGWVIENENSGLGVQPFREDDLLLIAAGKVEAQGVDVRRADFEPGDPVRRNASLLPRVDQTEAREAGEVGQSDVGRNRQEENEPLDAPFARDVADAEIDGVGRRFEPHLAVDDFEICRRCGEKSRRACASALRAPTRSPRRFRELPRREA